jgi:drug/metabolite transporter (DMT)-like permease
MLKEFKRRTNIGVGFGWIIMLIGSVQARSQSSAASVLGLCLLLVGAVLFVWGCVQYAKGKGQSGYWGALGLLWLLGLVALFFLPDRHKTQGAA